MIDRMDEIDGDPDEANGDELDGSMSEDEFIHHGANGFGHTGCAIADPGEDGGDTEEENYA